MATDRRLTEGTAIPTLAAGDKFYGVPAGGTPPWGYYAGSVLNAYLAAGGTLFPTGAFAAGQLLELNSGGTIVTTPTLTNKRITRRIVATTQSATPTINTDNGDIFEITGLAQAITSLTTNLSGTPIKGDVMQMWITDNGTARAITPGASFVGTAEFPLAGLTTTINKRLMLLWEYTTVWELVGKLNQA